MTKKKKQEHIKTCLVCDVARKELGNKDIIIGVYSGAIVVPEIPCSMSPFAVWLEIKPDKLHYENMHLEILNPNGTPIMGGKGMATFSDIKQYTGMPFQFPSIIFLSAGTYKIRFGFDDAMEEIGEFEVRQGEPTPNK